MVKSLQSQKRKRGVVLSLRGWQRLQAAEQFAALQDNGGSPYTLEQLSDKTTLSINTLTKVRRRQVAVDRQTLEMYFQAFDLLLEVEDFVTSDSATPAIATLPLAGQVPLDSPLYVYRPPAELLGCEAILNPGSLTRIKAPRQFGKTSLMARIMAYGREQQFQTVLLSLQLADATVMVDLNRFLRWFCAVVTHELGLQNKIDDYWDDLFGASYNCTNYFEKYLLPAAGDALVLALDEVDIVFHYPEVASDFFGMLRAWYEQAKYGDTASLTWRKLRLVVVHSTEVYLPLHLNQSPFNIGVLIELPGFTREQIQDLAQRYGIANANTCAARLIELLGGHPYLTQLALSNLSQQVVTIDQLITEAVTLNSIFASHLRKQL
ncbi:MAG TPA: AAA-like domain-containing protein, partial [Allocoleopsis sp.]